MTSSSQSLSSLPRQSEIRKHHFGNFHSEKCSSKSDFRHTFEGKNWNSSFLFIGIQISKKNWLRVSINVIWRIRRYQFRRQKAIWNELIKLSSEVRTRKLGVILIGCFENYKNDFHFWLSGKKLQFLKFFFNATYEPIKEDVLLLKCISNCLRKCFEKNLKYLETIPYF